MILTETGYIVLCPSLIAICALVMLTSLYLFFSFQFLFLPPSSSSLPLLHSLLSTPSSLPPPPPLFFSFTHRSPTAFVFIFFQADLTGGCKVVLKSGFSESYFYSVAACRFCFSKHSVLSASKCVFCFSNGPDDASWRYPLSPAILPFYLVKITGDSDDVDIHIRCLAE